MFRDKRTLGVEMMRVRNFLTISIPACAVFMVATATTVFAQATSGPTRDFSHYHDQGMMWGGGQWGGTGMFFGGLFMLFIVIGIIAVIILVLRLFGVVGTSETGNKLAINRNNAFDILKERFAKGEVDTKEFEERKRLLTE